MQNTGWGTGCPGRNGGHDVVAAVGALQHLLAQLGSNTATHMEALAGWSGGAPDKYGRPRQTPPV